jgi:hypothetical protein
MALIGVVGLGTLIHQYNQANEPIVPKFMAGECVREEHKDEFKTTYFYAFIEQIGQKQYLLRRFYYIDKNVAQTYGSGSGYPIEYVDRNYAKADCPEKIVMYE